MDLYYFYNGMNNIINNACNNSINLHGGSDKSKIIVAGVKKG